MRTAARVGGQLLASAVLAAVDVQAEVERLARLARSEGRVVAVAALVPAVSPATVYTNTR